MNKAVLSKINSDVAHFCIQAKKHQVTRLNFVDRDFFRGVQLRLGYARHRQPRLLVGKENQATAIEAASRRFPSPTIRLSELAAGRTHDQISRGIFSELVRVDRMIIPLPTT